MAHKVAVALTLLAAMVTGNIAAAQQAKTVTVQLLAINDLHGHLEPPVGNDGLVNKVPAGGVEYLATHLKNAIHDQPNSLIIGAGDMFGASPLLSSLFQEAPTIEALNALGMSVTAIGNHELDHGSTGFLSRIRGGCPQTNSSPSPCTAAEKYEAARFQYLAANVVTSSGSTLQAATAIRTIGGVRIGFIGETLEGTDQMLTPQAAKGLRFLEESAVANRAAAQLERQGVHTIILLLHLGGFQHPAEGSNAAINGCDNFSGEVVPVVQKLSPSIRIVVSAHTHVFYNCQIAGHIVTSARAFGTMFTRFTLSIDPRTDKLLNVTAQNEVVTRDVPKDPAQTAIIAKYRPRAAGIADRPAGSITADIVDKENPTGESPLGDVIADAQLEATSAPSKGGAVLALLNGPGIRANLVRAPGPDGRRNITFNDLYSAQPFNNQVVVITMTGDMLRRLLEQQFSADGGKQLLQVSAGFSYSYRLNAPAGQHIVPESMILKGRPIAPTDELRIATNDFLLAGGAGFTIFKESTHHTPGPVDIDALVDYFAKHSPVAPGPQDRVTRID